MGLVLNLDRIEKCFNLFKGLFLKECEKRNADLI